MWGYLKGSSWRQAAKNTVPLMTSISSLSRAQRTNTHESPLNLAFFLSCGARQGGEGEQGSRQGCACCGIQATAPTGYCSHELLLPRATAPTGYCSHCC
jgi:hypothetical protein